MRFFLVSWRTDRIEVIATGINRLDNFTGNRCDAGCVPPFNQDHDRYAIIAAGTLEFPQMLLNSGKGLINSFFINGCVEVIQST